MFSQVTALKKGDFAGDNISFFGNIVYLGKFRITLCF